MSEIFKFAAIAAVILTVASVILSFIAAAGKGRMAEHTRYKALKFACMCATAIGCFVLMLPLLFIAVRSAEPGASHIYTIAFIAIVALTMKWLADRLGRRLYDALKGDPAYW